MNTFTHPVNITLCVVIRCLYTTRGREKNTSFIKRIGGRVEAAGGESRSVCPTLLSVNSQWEVKERERKGEEEREREGWRDDDDDGRFIRGTMREE